MWGEESSISHVQVVCNDAETKMGVRTSGEIWLAEVSR